MLTHEGQMKALREYFPDAKDEDWRLWQAGQRVQIIKRDPKKGGVLRLGTEVVASKDGSIAALLGASPGASTAPSIMLDLLKKVFATRLATPAWQTKLREIVPSYGVKLNENPAMLVERWKATEEALQLVTPSPALNVVSGPLPAPAQPDGKVENKADLAV
jgi:malate dehydrogenase (quinone)